MDRRTQKYFRLFLLRFRRNYYYFLRNYTGKNLALYMDQFVHDNMKLAQVLFGDEGAKLTKDYARKMSSG